ncbi:ubiquitin carboxyl-terminal hydrolase 5-like [Uloborus diversus]|uniref:ubiquitin carboxyl-terminal hydrolase 5-like n=1 Tax=Uloborus diversus TaxID=327109 RepID=UPI002409DD51|nr:ubiquitin carboxyl-terminal hydrolase 5-like [Uloborus diversus]
MATQMLDVKNVRIPTPGDKIYKDECVLCFDTPESELGLYVCMNTFLGFCRKHVDLYFARTSNSIFLHLKRYKIEIENKEAEKVPTKLAIGLEGGFDVCGKKYEYEDKNSLVLLPAFNVISLPCESLAEIILLSISAILEHDAASKQEEADAMAGTWDGMQREVTKHANTLIQLDNGVKIPPNNWQCQVCGLKENLWLNLTDGAIHCGRKYFNGTGGNNHAVEYYEKTKYPLVVKLGSITSEASDVYSYDEDAMVLDPNLPDHLAHFGINIKELRKTDKSMTELEIDLNQRIGEWAIIQEAGTNLVPLYGPGYTGLANLGNSCYLNSVMQVVFNVPDFQRCYFQACDEIFSQSILDAPRDFNLQMAKLAYGLLSGAYSKAPEGKSKEIPEELPGIAPHMFKSLIGQGHPEFSTKRQQDAQEFFLHLISILERHARSRENPADALKFEVEERLQCGKSAKVKYTTRTDYLLSLPIPLDAATNKDEVALYEAKKAEILARGDKLNLEDLVRPRIPLQACLECFAASEIVDDFYSTALNAKCIAYKAIRLRTFPDYLMLHLKKFTIGEDWVPKKLDVSLDVPEELDLSVIRGKGIQPGEEELPETAESGKTDAEFVYDEALLYQLCDMGFPVDGCKKALYYTQNENIEAAMNWVMEHMNDADFNDPFDPPGVKKCNTNFTANPEATATIVSMGFTPLQAAKALEATNNDLERAIDWIFSHSQEMDTSEGNDSLQPQFRDGSEKYKLVAFISHMGTSTVAGHYVCHILKEGRWVIFNDNKVALSEHPPKDLAYLYLYQRIPAP